MNKYKRQIADKLFGISFVIFIFGSIMNVFLLLPFLGVVVSLINILKNNKKEDNFKENEEILVKNSANDNRLEKEFLYKEKEQIVLKNKPKIKKKTLFK